MSSVLESVSLDDFTSRNMHALNRYTSQTHDNFSLLENKGKIDKEIWKTEYSITMNDVIERKRVPIIKVSEDVRSRDVSKMDYIRS